MYEFHAWIALAESTKEADVGGLDEAIAELTWRLTALDWPTGAARVEVLNGQQFVTLTGLVNRRRHEAADIDVLLGFIAGRLPGSYGLVYERAADMPGPFGPEKFRVRALARGQITEHVDDLLSPTKPTIED